MYVVGQILSAEELVDFANYCATHQTNFMTEPVGDGTYIIKEIPEPAPLTHEETRQMREIAYEQEVDKITSHIQRLRDLEQTEEVVAEIEELIAERNAKVEEIKARYPYPEEI